MSAPNPPPSANVWDQIRADVLGANGGRATDARAHEAFNLGRMAAARAEVHGAAARTHEAQARADLARQRATAFRANIAARQARQQQAQQAQQQQAQQRAQRDNARQRAAQDKQAKAQALANERAAREQRTRRQNFVTRGVIGLRSAMPPTMTSGLERFENLPTPGGLGAVIAALIFFNLAIVPVGQRGESRLYLLWKALTGQSALPTTVGGASADASAPTLTQDVQTAAAQSIAEGVASGLAAAGQAGANSAISAAQNAAEAIAPYLPSLAGGLLGG